MKRTLMTGAAAATGLFVAAGGYYAPQAHAQPAFPPPGPPVWSWTGFYAGVHAGAVDGDIKDEVVGRNTDSVFVLDPNGVMGGVQAGYNFQIGRILLGIEGDIGFGDLDDRGETSDGTVEAKTEWIATIRGRLGHSWDRTLIYVTGGVAFTDLKIDYKYSVSAANFDHSGTESATGWTVGGGVEHALTDTVTLKAEYLYADFGKETFTFEDVVRNTTHDAEFETHHFRVGVNLLF